MFEGIFPPIVTPFNGNGEPDFEALEHNLSNWGNTKLSGYLVLGSNGEFVYMDKSEKLEVVKRVVENSEDKKVIVGTGKESTEQTILLTNEMAGIGVDAGLILPPHYYGESVMTDDALKDHYMEVADRSEVPILLYNMPKYTGMNLSKELVVDLSEHKNIVGMKDSSGDFARLGEYVDGSCDDFDVMVGTANLILGGLVLGASGGILALANVVPEECCKLYDLFLEGEFKEARDLQLSMIPLNKAITSKYGIKGLKIALEMVGYKGGYCKKPLRNYDLSCEEQKDLEDLVETFKSNY